jgi:hypothetical protein
MRFSFDVGNGNKSHIDFYRGPIFGAVTITANGKLVAFKDPDKLSTHLSFELVKRFEFTVGDRERHDVMIEQERPRLFGGVRRNKYRVIIDGKLLEEHHGF